MRLLTNWLAIKPNKMVSKAVVKRNIVEFGKINRPSCQMPNPHARAPRNAIPAPIGMKIRIGSYNIIMRNKRTKNRPPSFRKLTLLLPAPLS